MAPAPQKFFVPVFSKLKSPVRYPRFVFEFGQASESARVPNVSTQVCDEGNVGKGRPKSPAYRFNKHLAWQTNRSECLGMQRHAHVCVSRVVLSAGLGTLPVTG